MKNENEATETQKSNRTAPKMKRNNGIEVL